jgi:hypothetical protein
MFTVTTEGGGRSACSRHSEAGHPKTVTPWACPEADELLAMAHGLVPSARAWPGQVGMTRRRWELAAASETFEAWIIGWPPGGVIALHDHGGSSGAVVVAGGELVETYLTEDVDGSFTSQVRRMPTGSSWTMAGRYVHDVVNAGPTPAVSVHVYAPRLTSMTHYRLNTGVLSPERTVHYRLGAMVP